MEQTDDEEWQADDDDDEEDGPSTCTEDIKDGHGSQIVQLTPSPPHKLFI